MRVTGSGLQYRVLHRDPRDRLRPTEHSKVRVHYEGRLIDGTVFDSSEERAGKKGQSFTLGKVVKGWNEGLLLMREGDEFEFYLPPELGYEAKKRGRFIYPHAVLIFKITLIEVETGGTP